LIHFITLSIFPQIFESPLKYSIIKKAKDKGLIKINHFDIRDFSKNKHKKVDDYQAGGGAGLLLKPDVLDRALESIRAKDSEAYYIFVTPVAKTFKQVDAKRLAKKEHIVLVSGRYEGIDERIVEKWADEVFSIGDFILTGGELPSLCICDAVCRNIDGVLGNSGSLVVESFEESLLEAPSFTKPNIFEKTASLKSF